MQVCVTGHRPSKIGGYDRTNEIRVALRGVMRAKLVELSPERAISGMALGIDQDFVEICLDLGIPFVAAVPFRGQEGLWPDAAQRYYDELLAKAVRVHYVCEPGYAVWKMEKRNRWMVDEVGEDGRVLAVWDGSEGGTGNCVKYATRVKRKIVRIDPDAVVSGL